MTLLNVLRHLAPRQSLHCGTDQSRDVVRRGVLRERLEARAPDDMETRESFLARLRRTVDWLNRNRVAGSTQLCTNLKTRAHELKEALHYVVDEKNQQADLTENGRNLINPDDPDGFVIPDLATIYVEIDRESGASDDEKNSLAYSVYSEQRKKKPVLPTQVSVPKAKKKSQAKRANSSNESSENY